MSTTIPATTGPTGEQAAARRREMVDACQRVILARGFENTRMSDIAAEMGVTAPLLLHYFGSKNELVTAALMSADEPYLQDLKHRFESGVSPALLLVRYVEDCIWPAPDGNIWWRQASAIWMNAWTTAMHDPAIAAARAEEDRRWRDLLTEIVRSGQAAGTFRQDIEAAAFVRTMLALLDGFIVQMVLDDPEVTKPFVHEQSFRFLANELGFDPEPSMSAGHRRRRRR